MSASSIGSTIINSLGAGKFDVNNISTTLAQADFQSRIDLVKSKQDDFTQRSTSLDTLKAAMSGFLNQIKSLNSMNTQQTVKSSNSSITASINDPTKVTGNTNFSVAVQQLATNNILSSSGFSSTSNSLGNGTLSIGVGSAVTDITIDNTNNTLSGIKDAINKAGAGVSASIVNDKQGSHLVLSGNSTGSNANISVNVKDSDGNNDDTTGLSQLAYNNSTKNLTQNQVAKDAIASVNGMQLTSSTNTFYNAIDGIDFNVSSITTTPSTLTVGTDTKTITDNINNFVTSVNDLDNVVNNLGSHVKSKTDPLQGSLSNDPLLSSLKQNIHNILNTHVNNTGEYHSLAEIGITTQSNGTLAIDQSKLSTALTNHPQDVMNLFSSSLSGNGVSLKSSPSTIKTGDYNLSINQLASKAKIEGSSVGGTGSDAITLNNMSLSVIVNSGKQINLIMNGDFTKDTLSKAIQESVNNLSPDKINVLFNSNTGRFEFYSQQYGSSQSIKIETTDQQANALGINSATATGSDVTGSLQGQNNYVFNGKGQDVSINSFLAGSPTGLNFSYTGSETGSVGSINYSRGIADSIASVFNDMMSSTGLLTSTQNSYKKIISALQSQQAKLQTGEVAAVTRYATQFQTANKIIRDMNSISSSFTSSLGNNINKTA